MRPIVAGFRWVLCRVYVFNIVPFFLISNVDGFYECLLVYWQLHLSVSVVVMSSFSLNELCFYYIVFICIIYIYIYIYIYIIIYIYTV